MTLVNRSDIYSECGDVECFNVAACPLNERSLYHYSIRLVPASVNVIRSFFLRRIYSYDFLPLRFRFILSTYQLSDNGYTHKLRHDRTSSFSLSECSISTSSSYFLMCALRWPIQFFIPYKRTNSLLA